MKNIRVEINGLNTSTLPLLDSKCQLNMLKEIKAGKTYLKEEFIKANLRLVLSIVKKFNSRGENVDDIFQVGVVGLIKAIDNFDISQNVQFSTYAVPMILGEIKRFFRDSSSMRISRSIRDTSYKISKIKEEYVNKYNTEPTVEYLSKTLDIPQDEIILALDSMTLPMSIYDSVYSDGDESIYIIDKLKSEENVADDFTEKLALKQAMGSLTDKEMFIIKRRYFDNLTQVELAKEIGVSQAQVSRIEKLALARIKRKMNL